MTRKGVALVSAAALSLAGFAAPSFGAQADTSKVSLAPVDGDAYAVVGFDGATFTLESNEAVPIVGGALSWAISGGGLSVLPFGAASLTTGQDGTVYALDNAEDVWLRTDDVVTVVSGALDGEVDEDDIVYIPEAALAGVDADGDDADVLDRAVVVTDQKDAAAAFDTAAATDTWERTDDVVTIDVADLAGLAAGDWIELAGDEFTGDDSVDAGYYQLITVDGTEATFANAGDDEANDAAQDAQTITPLAYFSFEDAGNDVAQTATDNAVNIEAYSSAFVEYDADEDILYVDSGRANAALTETLVLYHVYDDSDGAVGAEVTVTAWVDDDNDRVIDGTEYASPVRTVTFLAADEISIATIEWTAVLGSDAVSADVTFDPEINWDNSEALTFAITNAADEGFTEDAFAFDEQVVTFGADVDDNELDDGFLTLDLTTTTTGEDIGVRRLRIVDNDVDDVIVEVTTGADIAQSDADENVTLREEEAHSFTVTVTIEDADDDAIEDVEVVISDGGASSLEDEDNVVTVGGEAVDTDDGSFDDVTLTSNAAGQVTFVITNSLADDGDVLDLDFTAEDISQTITFTWDAAAYNFRWAPYVPAHGAAVVTDQWLGSGNSTTLSFWAFDQFGQAPETGMFRVEVTADQNDADDEALDTVTKFGRFNAAGLASVTISDGAAGSENPITVASELQAYDEDGDTWDDDETLGGDIAVTSETIDAADLTLSTLEDVDVVVTVDDDEPASVATSADEDLGAYSFQTGDADPNFAGGVNLTGSAELEVNGDAFAGGHVTISGSSNLVFKNTDGGALTYQYASGSLTAVLDANGIWDFTVFSNVAGEYEVTITAGGTSETATIEFDAIDGDAGLADTEISISAPAYTMPGSTFIATITLTDQFGNPVTTDAADAFTVDWDGPGLISGTLPDETDDDGQARVYILFGSNETGSGELTVTYFGEDADLAGENDAGDPATDDNIVATHTVTLGAAPAPAADTKVNAGSFKGYVAIYAKGHEGKRLSAKVGKDWVVVPALASNFVRVVEYTGAGYTIAVRIYIDRVLVDTITVTTK